MENTIIIFVCNPKFCIKHCFQFLLGLKNGPKRKQKQCSCKIWRDKKEYYGIFQSDLLSTELRFVFQDIQVQYVALIVHDGRRGGLMVRVLDSGSSGPGSGSGWGHCVEILGKTLYSHGASLHPGV